MTGFPMKPLDQSSAESLSTVAAAGDTAIKNLYTALEQVKTPISSETFASAASRLDSDIEQAKDKRLFVADSDMGSYLGNTLVAAVAGTTRTVGTMLSSPAALLREDTDIPVDVVEAYRRVQLAKQLNNAPAESDLAIINQIDDPYNTANHPQLAQYGADYNPVRLLQYDDTSSPAQRFQSGTAPHAVPIVPADGVIMPSTRTYAERLDMSAMGANWVRNVTKAADYSAYVDQTAPMKAIDDFGKTYDEVAPELSAAVDKFTTEGTSALGDVLVAASKASVAFTGTALSNADAIPQLVAENAPQTILAGNPYTSGFFTAGYGEQQTQQAIDAIEKKQGSPATPQQKLDARLYANASAAVETLSSMVTLGIGSGIKGIKGLKATAATLKTSEAVAEAVIKPNKALLFLKDTVAPVAGRTGTAALTEGTEEGIQKSLESKAAGQEATWREIVQDAGVGALAGGGMTMGRAGIDVTKNASQSLAEATRNALKSKEKAPVVQPTPTVSDAQKARTEALNKIIQETPDLATVTSVTDKADSMFHWASTADFTDQTTQDTAKKYLDDIAKLTDVTQIGSGTTVYDQIANAPDETTKQKWTDVAESLDKAAARMTVKLNNDVRTPTERVQAATTPQEKIQAYGSHDIQDFSNDDLKVMATWKNVPEHIQANVGKEIAIRSTMDEVSNNFTSGGKSSSLNAENLTGIEQHLTDFTHALRTGDKATAQSTLGVVANWAEKQNLKVALLNEVIGALSVGDKAKVADLTEQMNTSIPRPKNGMWSFRSVRGAQKLLADAQVDAAKLNAGYKTMQELATGVDTGIKPTVEPTPTVTPVEPTTATTESVTSTEPTVEPTNTVEPTTQTMTVSRTNKADGTYIVHSVVPHTSAKGKFVVSATSTESISGKPQTFVVDNSGQVYTKKRGAKVYTPQVGTTVSGVFEATQTNTTEQPVSESATQTEEVTPTQTDETISEETTPETEVDESIHWFKRAKERTVNILGEVVNRFANSFQLDTQRNRSLLAVVPDLMNRVTDPSWDYSHRLSNWNEVKYTAVWNDFSKFHDAVADSIRELIKGSAGKSETYAYQNPLAEFTQDVPPEMVTAIAAAMYDFLVTDARGTVFNSFKDMQFLSTTDKVETVPFDVYDALRHAGKPRFELEIAMGKAAFNALGMTTKGTAEQHSQGTFSNALGLIARQVLEDAGYLQATPIRDVLGNTSLPLEKSTTILYRAGDVGVDEQGETAVSLFNDIESLINNHKEDPTTIGNLFRLPSSQLFPATEVPKDKTKRFIGNTQWAVPAKVNELFNRKAKVAHEFNPTIIGYLDSIPNGMELLKLAAGYTKDTAQYIAGIKQTLDANNDQIERTIGLVGSFRQVLKNKKTSKFHISNELWINHREGMQSAINPQTNKIIRNLITPIAWESTFTKTDTMPDFLVKAIGQSLGVNHENKSAQEFRLAVEQKLAEEPIQKALQAIAESKAADDTVRYLDTILVGVEAGGEHVHSLLGLLTYADYLATREGDKFTHRAYTEDDGKTSGVAISMVQLSRTLNMKVLNKFGLLTNDNYRSYADYKDLDAYQSLGMQLKDALENLPPIKALFGALVTEDARPTSALRNLAKPLTMTPFYGSGMPGLMSAFLGEQVLPKIHIRLNDAKTLDDVNQVLGAYNYLLGSKRHRDVLKVQSFNPDSVLDTVLVYPNEAPGNTLLLRDFIVSSRTFTAMQELLTDILREDIVGKEGVLNTTYGPQLEAQRKYGELVTAMGVMYQELRQRKIDAVLEERANQAGIPVEKYKTAHTLTIAELAAVDKELLEVTPAIKSAMFSPEDGLNAQVPLTEQDVVMGSIDINSPYRSQLMVKGKGVKSVAGEVVVTPRQTGAVAISTHSTDGSIIFSTGMNVPNGETAWGIHDATAGGENIADAMTKGMNQHFHEIVVQKYSYMAEGLATFERIAAEYTTVTGEKEISMGKDNIVLSAMAKEFHQLVTDIKTNQQEIDKAVHTYDQYVGTPYEAHPRANQQQVLGNIGNTATGTVRSPDALGSHAASNNSQNFTEHLDITPATSEAVFDQLANPSGKQDSAAHTAHLRSVLVNALNKGLKQVQAHIAQSIGYTSYGRIQGTDMYIVNAQHGPNQYAKQNFGSLVMSTQEVYVHELVHGIAAWAVDNNPAVRAELKRMWKAAQSFARHPKNRALYNQNKEMFDRVFDPKFINGKSDYLQEFLAYANTNADMIALLKQVSLPALKSRWFVGDNLFEKATSFFSTLVDMLRGRVLHLKSDQVDVRMGELLRHIATIDSTHRGLAMALAQRFRGPLDGLYEISNTSLKTGLDKLYKAIRKGGRVGRAVSAVLLPAQVVLNQPNNPALKFIKAAGKRFEHYMTESENAGLREVAALVREGRSRNKKNSAIVEAIASNKTAGDRARQTLNTNTVTALRSSFDPNVTWEPKHYAALTYVLARSGFEYLLGMTPNLGSALNLITNNARRQSEITRVSAELDAAVNNDAFYRLQAQNLAWLTVDGQGVGLSLPRYSPYAIAQGRSGTETVDPKVEKLVQQLTALYALNYLTADIRNTAVEVIRHEMNRRDSYGVPIEFNGITTLLGNIASLRKDAEQKLFNGTKGLMQFGYIGDTFAAQMDVQYSTDSADPDLLAKGYTQEGVLRGDHVVPNVVPKYIYVNRTGGLAKLDTGAFLLDSKRSRGTDITPPIGMTMNTMVNTMMRTKVGEDNQTYNRGALVINSKAEQNAVPRWDTQGNVLGFRYLMGEKLKDTMLQREMDITKVLGNLTASTYIKANVRELNQVALAAVKQMYDTQYQDNPEDFVLIGPKAVREEDRAAWAILPYETKADALKLFGSKDGFYVRRDSRTLNFGQRSYSLRNIWDKADADRNLVEKAVHTVATRFFGNEAANKLVVANDFFVTLATIAKDFIVIKSFIVTLSNTVSNMLLNRVNGIGVLEQIKAMTTAYTEAVAYQKAEARLTQLNVLLASTSLTGPTRTRYEEERVILQEDMRVNVVGEMIRAGALQSIEDITKDAEKGLYDLIPGAKTISDTYGKIVKSGSWGDTLIRNGLIMQNSALYKQLRIAAQMSDFVSKYAYVQNRVNRKNNPLNLKQAIREASELFIEYNLPSGVFTQALNDIGLLMFTKYLIRVQKTILTTTLNYPIRTLMMVLMTDWLNVPSSIMSSFMDNPLQRMAFPGLSLLKAADEGLGTRILSTVY